MDNKIMTADEIFQTALTKIAPLPCQESYLRELAAIFAFHMRKNALMDRGFQASELPAQHAIVVAPTGAGKTFVFREMARMLDLNTIILDGSSMSRDGWKGSSFGQQLLASRKECPDQRRWEASLVLVDEIDKARLYNNSNDQGNVQDNLLQLFNNGVVSVENSDRSSENLYVGRFTIILGGAFSGLEKIIEQRIAPRNTIGFIHKYDTERHAPAEWMQHTSVADIEKYGIKRELLGRIGSVITIDPMKEEDYRALLISKNGSIQRRYRDYFIHSSGVDFAITEKAVRFLCKFCQKESTGARAVNPAINDLMRSAIIMVDRDASINKVILDAEESACVLRYEYGERLCVPLAQKGKHIKPYTMRAKDITTLTDKLCLFYQELPHPCFKKEVMTFLGLALSYLNQYTSPNDFCFESLEKLAHATDKSANDQKSVFDIMISEVLKNPTHDRCFDIMYEDLSQQWTPSYTHNLTNALICLRNLIEDRHKCAAIQFTLQRCTTG